MIRITCSELLLSESGTIEESRLLTFDVEDADLDAWLRGASPTSRRRIQGGELLGDECPDPGPDPGPEPEPPVPAEDCDILRDVPGGVPVDENLFGYSILHAGEYYFTPNMTPEGGATGGRMLFKWSRCFGSWKNIEKTQGSYDWTTVQGKADYYAARQLRWSLVLFPVPAQGMYGAGPKGPPSSEPPYKNLLLSAFRRFWDKGLRALEICNEPETDNWYGSLGYKPKNHNERRRTARELSPWARVAHEAAAQYLNESGHNVEIWASSSQSMAEATPNSGLARVFNDPSPEADAEYGGAGFLNGSDKVGGCGAEWLDRFTFHGYPSPTHDPKLLHDHFNKARRWCEGAGIGEIPMVVTEHGVLSDRNSGSGDRATGAFREWKTDNPYTGKNPPFTDQERLRWVLNAFAVSAIHNARMIWYAWDEQYMGIYGYANGSQGQRPDAPLGWCPTHQQIETKYKSLRDKLIGRRVFTLWRRKSDGLFIVSVGDDAASELIYLE